MWTCSTYVSEEKNLSVLINQKQEFPMAANLFVDQETRNACRAHHACHSDIPAKYQLKSCSGIRGEYMSYNVKNYQRTDLS